MSSFDDQLWSELVRLHGSELQPRELRTVRRRSRKAPIAAGALATSAGAVALALTLSAGSAPAAYAVTQNPDGTLSVTLSEIVGVSGANAELERLGVDARVVPVEDECPPPSGARAAPAVPASIPMTMRSVTISPKSIPPGDTLLIEAQQISDHTALGVTLIRGSAPACLPLAKQVIPQRIQ